MNGFAMFDLIAKRNSTWGYVYPFIELALGLAYLPFPLAYSHLHCDHNSIHIRGHRC